MSYQIYKPGWVTFRGGPPRNYHYLPPDMYVYSAHLIGDEILVSYSPEYEVIGRDLLKCIPVTGLTEDDHEQIYKVAHDYLYKFDGKIHLGPDDPLYNYFREKRLKNETREIQKSRHA
ncbi:TPA: hypothetical protein ACPDKP_000754 [Pasteurella multocida]